MTQIGSWLLGLGTEVIALGLWCAALVIVRRRVGGAWRSIATWALVLLIVGQLLDLPLAWASRESWSTPELAARMSLSVRLSAIGAMVELAGYAGLVAAVFRGRRFQAAPRRGREIV